MKINRCMNCMAETETYPCPHCGYNGEQNPDHALPCGSILNGRYLVGRVLGQGGFGITYTGWDLSLERKLAIKEYYPGGQVTRTRQTGVSLLWGQTDQAQLLRENGKKTVLHEAQKMAKLEAVPEAVHVRDVFQENDTAYIVMDFVEGETLQHKLKREGPMSWKDAEKLFLPLISAMEKVHAAGIIHRDLSPDNFMLQPDGQARILDLGAAKDIQTSTGASSALVVKNGFSPIEQYGTRGGSGTWTDVYAMAATIYYALTGQVPPAATDRIVKDTMDFTILPVPASVMKALKNALEVKSDERTQTMGQFLKELQAEESKKKEETKSEDPEREEPKKEELKKIEPKKEEPKTEPVKKVSNDEQRKQKKSKTPLLIAAACAVVALIVVLVAAFGGNKVVDNQVAEPNTTVATTESATTNTPDDIVITVAAYPTPHAEILAVAGEVLAEQGYTLEVTEYSDYVVPNNVVEDGEIDANYFQHQPYLDTFNEENGTHLVSVCAVHYEPFGIYAGTKSSIEELADGDQIAIPNDGSNRARALLLLEAQGILTLKDGVGMEATALDIEENPLNLDIVEMEQMQLGSTRDSMALVVINSNYALEAGLNVDTDAIATEDPSSVSAQTYANVLVVKEGNEDSEKIQALKAALLSDKVREFIRANYSGAIAPAF